MGMLINPFQSVAASVWTTVFSGSAGSGSTGWAGWTMRQRIPAAQITDVSGSQVRFTLHDTLSNGMSISKMYVGLAGAGTYDFSAAPTQAFFSGSASAAVLSGGNELTCDGVTLAYTGTADLMVSVFFAASPATSITTYSMTGANNGQKLGDDAITTLGTGYSNSAFTNAFRLVEALVP
jgi:hypothetical protein